MSRIPSIMSYSSILFSQISFLMSFRSFISFSRSCFCYFKNYRLLWISLFCYQLRFRASFSSKNHQSSSYSSFPNKCFPSAADHIIYLCKAGKLRFTICLKYSLIVLIRSFPVAPILYLKLSMISLIYSDGSSPFFALQSSPWIFFIISCRLAVNPLIYHNVRDTVLFWFTTRCKYPRVYSNYFLRFQSCLARLFCFSSKISMYNFLRSLDCLAENLFLSFLSRLLIEFYSLGSVFFSSAPKSFILFMYLFLCRLRF